MGPGSCGRDFGPGFWSGIIGPGFLGDVHFVIQVMADCGHVRVWKNWRGQPQASAATGL